MSIYFLVWKLIDEQCTNKVQMHQEIILVEGLKLDGVPAGLYSLNCLPLRLVGSEASPIRCILIGWWSPLSCTVWSYLCYQPPILWVSSFICIILILVISNFETAVKGWNGRTMQRSPKIAKGIDKELFDANQTNINILNDSFNSLLRAYCCDIIAGTTFASHVLVHYLNL